MWKFVNSQSKAKIRNLFMYLQPLERVEDIGISENALADAGGVLNQV